ncbi:MAG: xanthine dehydrogenase family protein molybdopterin-binding subunit, partial [Nocardioidaceae bacterium]
MPGSILGNAVPRVEDPDLIRGRGTYVGNMTVPGMLHAAFVRSPFAHARITAIDTGEAEKLPGVVAVYTAESIGVGPMIPFVKVNGECRRLPLAADKVRFVGEQVALVVAESAAVATDALELVDVDYDPLPVASDPESALADGAPLQFDELGSNIAAGVRDADGADVLAGADRVVRARVENQRLAVAPIEPNAVLAQPGPGRLTVHLSTQMPHLARKLIADTFGLENDAVRVVAPHVGGAFGGKAGLPAEHVAVIAASRLLDRPVRWAETRSEAMLSMHGRGQVQYAELGLRHDGTIVGMRWRVVGDCGAYAGFGGGLALGPTYAMAQGVYRIPALAYDAIAALTNTAPVGAFRGAGRPEAAALLERMMDLAAYELEISPVDLRRHNLLGPDEFPYTTRVGTTYDVGDYDLPLREVLRVSGYDELRREQAERRARGDARQLGIGLGLYVEITGSGGGEFGSVEVHPDATATVMAGTSAHGQGHATSFSMIVADRLGLPMEQVDYVQSDTARVPRGGGTGGSRSLQLGGNAVGAAADAVLEQARGIAARMLEAAPGDVQLEDGTFGVAGIPDVSLRWADVAAYAEEHDEQLSAGLDFSQDGATFPFGAHVSVVEVDTETGMVTPLRHVAVDDCGRVLNPLIVTGQQHGGSAQGIAQA